jgi:hypothetical protein
MNPKSKVQSPKFFKNAALSIKMAKTPLSRRFAPPSPRPSGERDGARGASFSVTQYCSLA